MIANDAFLRFPSCLPTHNLEERRSRFERERLTCRRQREYRQLIEDGCFPNLQYIELRTPAETRHFIDRISEASI